MHISRDPHSGCQMRRIWQVLMSSWQALLWRDGSSLYPRPVMDALRTYETANIVVDGLTIYLTGHAVERLGRLAVNDALERYHRVALVAIIALLWTLVASVIAGLDVDYVLQPLSFFISCGGPPNALGSRSSVPRSSRSFRTGSPA